MTLFTASGASCGTVTHSLSHSPNTAGIFSTSGNGYSWYTNDSSLADTYTITVTATEDGCATTLTDTYTVNVLVNCENLTISPPAAISQILYEIISVGA